MEALDRYGNLPERLREFRVRILPQGAVDADGEEGPPALARPGQPRAADALGFRGGGTQQRVEPRGREPLVDLAADPIQIHAIGAVVAREVEDVPHPVGVDVRVDAVVLQEGDRDAWNRGRFHERERFLEHGEAADADDRVDLPRLNDGRDKRRTFCHQDGVAEPLGFILQILDGAEAAVLTQQAEFVEGCRTLGLHAQALGEHQQSALVRDAGERIAPGFVVEQHGHVVAIFLLQSRTRDDRVGVHAEIVDGHRRNRLQLRDVRLDHGLDAIALETRLRNRLLRRPLLLNRQQARENQVRLFHGCAGL